MLSSRVDKLTRRVSTTYRPLSPLAGLNVTVYSVMPSGKTDGWTADLSTHAIKPCRQVDRACQHPPALGRLSPGAARRGVDEGVARAMGISFSSWVDGAVGSQPHGPRPTPPPSVGVGVGQLGAPS